MRVEHRAVADLGRGGPVALELAALVPVLGNVAEQHAGALLALGLDQDLIQLGLRFTAAEQARWGRPLALPGRTEAVLMPAAVLIAPARAPDALALALIQPHVAADAGGGIESRGCHDQRNRSALIGRKLPVESPVRTA